MRRIEFAMPAHNTRIESEGPELWRAVDGGTGEDADVLVGLFEAIVELDRLGDALATWAVDRTGTRPDAAVDAVTADVAQRLETLGIPREERTRPARQRG